MCVWDNRFREEVLWAIFSDEWEILIIRSACSGRAKSDKCRRMLVSPVNLLFSLHSRIIGWAHNNVGTLMTSHVAEHKMLWVFLHYWLFICTQEKGNSVLCYGMFSLLLGLEIKLNAQLLLRYIELFCNSINSAQDQFGFYVTQGNNTAVSACWKFFCAPPSHSS